MTLRAACLAALLAAPAAAEDRFDYEDWRVVVERVDTGQDIRVTCVAMTGGDGLPTLRVYTSDGDVRPPDMFPWVSLEESAPRGYATLMRDGDLVRFAFDEGTAFEAQVRGGFDAEGFAVASAMIDETDMQAALRAMRAAGRVAVIRDGETVYDASLAGFAAAYRKLAERCDFPVSGVLD
jgi:hypothetical protein